MVSRKKWRGQKKWTTAPVDRELSARIASELHCSPILADLLVRRGITSPEEGFSFLEPRLSHLADPSLLPEMDRAVGRISRAVQDGETIAIFGDYDVDGVASTVLLLEFFQFIRCPVRYYLPHRIEEGFGLNREAIGRLAGEGVRLIITVDNGSSAVDEVAFAASLGMDVVITDHHVPSDPPPRPFAFVNPWLPGSVYPFPCLAGVGVTFKVIWEICRHLSRSKKVSEEFRRFMMESLGLVALGTISDVAPLTGENRVLAHFGLEALAASSRPGLRSLVRMALQRGSGRRNLTARDVAFRIGPCLNATGRLGEADRALQLLITSDPSEADELLGKLVRENERRRKIEKQVHEEARDRLLEEVDLKGDRVVVLAKEGWHPGVIGIVAARLVEEFYRPTLLISLEGEMGKGSARSIPQVSICDALERASGCLEGFGGHARAAGIRIASSKVEELRRTLNQVVEVIPSEMVPELQVDGEYRLSEWTPRLVRELDRLSPFGEGNPEPLFALRSAEVVGVPRVLGRDGSHLSFFVRQGNTSLRAIAFGMAEYGPAIRSQNARVSLLYQPQLSTWGNEESVELRVEEVDVHS